MCYLHEWEEEEEGYVDVGKTYTYVGRDSESKKRLLLGQLLIC